MRKSINEEQNEIIYMFNDMNDWMLISNYIIERASKSSSFSEQEKEDSNRICIGQARVWVYTSYNNGKIIIKIDSESLIINGIASIIIDLLNKRTPDEIRKSEISFISETCIVDQISKEKYLGIEMIIKIIKNYSNNYL